MAQMEIVLLVRRCLQGCSSVIKKTESPMNVDKRGIILRISLYLILIFRTFKSDKK